jgi:RNA polymerase sigma factor (sigma-70 family)
MTKRQQEDARHRVVVGTYYQTGDAGPLGAVLEELRPRLLGMLWGRLGVRDSVLAEELAQQTLTRLLEELHAGKYEGSGSLASYALSVCRRRWLMCLRLLPRQPSATDTPELLLSACATPAEDIPASEVQQAATAVLSAATSAVLALDQHTRAAVVLHFYHGLDTLAAAAKLGITDVAFRERLRRGVAALQAWGRTVPHPAAEVYAALRGVDSGDLFREPLRMAS